MTREEELFDAEFTFIEAWENGQHPTLEEWCWNRYPRVAGELCDFILLFLEIEAAVTRTPEPTPEDLERADRACRRALEKFWAEYHAGAAAR